MRGRGDDGEHGQQQQSEIRHGDSPWVSLSSR
jgi:hypothetical protein